MLTCCKDEFSCKQLSLHHDQPIIFVTSQWQKEKKPSTIYLCYRWIIAVIFTVTMTISIIDLKHPDSSPPEKAKWLIYLTHWGYVICTLQTLLAAIILSICLFASYYEKPNVETSALKFYTFYWLFNVTSTDLAFAITVLYWSLIYDKKTMEFDAINFFVHIFNSIAMMLDLFVVSHPVRLLHFCYPFAFGVCYSVFSVVYYASGGTTEDGHIYIYKILDWRQPGISSAVCVASLGFLLIVHVFCWALYNLRLFLYYKCVRKEGIGVKNSEEMV